jgi:hypothetical protein
MTYVAKDKTVPILATPGVCIKIINSVNRLKQWSETTDTTSLACSAK